MIWSNPHDYSNYSNIDVTEQTLISPPDKLSVSSPRPSWRLRWSHCGRQAPGQVQLVSQWPYHCVITITVSIIALFMFDIISDKDQEYFKSTSSAGTISSSSSSSALKEKVKGLQFTSRALKCLTDSRVRYWVWHSLTVYTLIYRLHFAEDVLQIDTLIIQIRLWPYPLISAKECE